MTSGYLSFFFSGLLVAFALFPGMTHAAEANAANAEDAFSALDAGDESLPTAEDFAEAQGTERNAPPVAEILDYQQVPLAQTNDIKPTPSDGSLSSSSPPVTQPANTASVPRTFGGPLRLELGLGWSTHLSGLNGPAGLLGLKFRPTRWVPIFLGAEASASWWSGWTSSDGPDVTYRGSDVKGLLTLSVYPTRYFYFMHGVGFSHFYESEKDKRSDHSQSSSDFHMNLMMASGVEFRVADVFQIGIQLRGELSFILRDSGFLSFGCYLVTSFL